MVDEIEQDETASIKAIAHTLSPWGQFVTAATGKKLAQLITILFLVTTNVEFDIKRVHSINPKD